MSGYENAAEPVGNHHEPGGGVVEDIADLVLPVHGTDRVGHGADLRRRAMNDQPLGPVRQLDRDDIARTDALLQEAARGAMREPVQVLVGETPSAVDDGELVATRTRAASQVIVERAIGPLTALHVSRDRQVSW